MNLPDNLGFKYGPCSSAYLQYEDDYSVTDFGQLTSFSYLESFYKTKDVFQIYYQSKKKNGLISMIQKNIKKC